MHVMAFVSPPTPRTSDAAYVLQGEIVVVMGEKVTSLVVARKMQSVRTVTLNLVVYLSLFGAYIHKGKA